MATAVEGSRFTPEQLQYWVEHKDDSRVPNIIACATVTAFVSTLCIALRLTGRRWLEGRFRLHISDWLVVVAWVFFMLSTICFAMLASYGGGRHVIYITDTLKLQVMSIVSEGAYGVAMGFLKFSILALYGTIFPSRTFRRYLWAVALFITGWTLASSLGAILQCVPIAKAFDGEAGGYCINYGVLSLVVGIFNVITDFIILVLPIPLVLKLNASAEKKRAVIITFAAGCSAVIVSIVRLVYSLQVGSVDGSWNAIPAGYASCVELTVGFLVVSIPVYRKFYTQVYKGDEGGMTGLSYRSGHTPLRSNKSSPSAVNGSYSNASGGYKTSVMTNTSTGENESQQGIHITSDVELTTHANKNGPWARLPDEESVPRQMM